MIFDNDDSIFSRSEYALLREQTDEALKLLDDVVNSELADEENNKPLGMVSTNNKPKIFQFIPPGQVERSAQLAQIRADLDQRVSNNARPPPSNTEMLFKKNPAKSKVKQHSRKSNASSSSNHSNNKMSMEERAAAIGIRNGVLSKLGQYHPQWMAGSGSNVCCEISQAPPAVVAAKMKLRHTESARQASILAQQQQHKSLKQSLSFLRKEDFVRECSPYYSSDEERKHVNLIKYSPSKENYNNKGGKFVLKPAQSNHDVSSFYFKDLAPSSKLNRRFFSRNCDQPIMKPVMSESRNGSSVVLNAYKSEPSLIAAASAATTNTPQNKKYRFNDFFY